MKPTSADSRLTPAQIMEAARLAGLAGAGGGGFPTHAKLAANADVVIANGSECEPLLASDKTLMKTRPRKIIEGLHLAMRATGASRGVIAVKAHYRDAVGALEKEIPPNGPISLHLLENYYPAGDEFLTVHDVTGRIVPEGGIPPQAGVLTLNVLTLALLADAVNGKPAVSRPITVAGSVRNPRVVDAPIGTTYAQLLEMAGGTVHPDDRVFDGGPMMGRMIHNLEDGVAKTTGGVIALPADHIIPRFREISLGQMVKQSKAACCQCYRCTDLCPRALLGHQIHPHLAMRALDYQSPTPAETVTAAFLCSQCGVCELIACDFMLLSPRRIYAEYKRLLTEKGIQNPHRKQPERVSPELYGRKIPLSVIERKLQLTPWLGESPYLGDVGDSVRVVHIPLDRYAGPAAVPVVQPGDRVRCGDIIAVPPEDAPRPGVIQHASISGYVRRVAAAQIVVAAAPPKGAS